jgi:long-chain acyl-coA synthetases (AMP-forming)
VFLFCRLTKKALKLIILSNGENVSPEELEADFLKYDEVQEVLVYEENGMIIVEIYPDEE